MDFEAFQVGPRSHPTPGKPKDKGGDNGILVQRRKKNRQNKLIVEFNEENRIDFLTGFRKRKEERRKTAQLEAIKMQREAKLLARKQRREALKDKRDEILREESAKLDLEESEARNTSARQQQYAGPERLITVTTVASVDLDPFSQTSKKSDKAKKAKKHDSDDDDDDDDSDNDDDDHHRVGNDRKSASRGIEGLGFPSIVRQKRRFVEDDDDDDDVDDVDEDNENDQTEDASGEEAENGGEAQRHRDAEHTATAKRIQALVKKSNKMAGKQASKQANKRGRYSGHGSKHAGKPGGAAGKGGKSGRGGRGGKSKR